MILEQGKRVDLKQLAEKRLREAQLRFSQPPENTPPGNRAVSCLRLINDSNKEVEVVLDKDLLQSDQVNFHPNVNTATLTLSFADFKRFLDHCGQKVLIL